MKNKICFIDFETTGIDVFKDNPIEIGAVMVNSEGIITNKFHSMIRPRNKRIFSVSSKNIHGLESINLLIARSQVEVLDDFFNKFGTNYRFAGWNINFDVSFFRRMCHISNRMREFNKINHRHIDVQTIKYLAVETGVIDPSIKSLSDLAKLYNIKRKTEHSAIEDAEITAKVYFHLLNLFKKKIN